MARHLRRMIIRPLRARFLTLVALLALLPPRTSGAAPEPAGVPYGTGFFISTSGLLVTAGHVVQRCRRVLAQTASGTELEVSTVRVDTASDVAVLQARGSRPQSALTLRRDPRPQLGEEVRLLGYPFLDALAGAPTFDSGIVSGLTGIEGDPNNFRISVPLEGGFSGAAVVDRSGLVMGLARGFAARSRPNEGLQPANINLAVSGTRLIDLLRSNPAIHMVATAPALSLPQAADLLTRASVLVRCVS